MQKSLHGAGLQDKNGRMLKLRFGCLAKSGAKAMLD